jgi:hypothetical protein
MTNELSWDDIRYKNDHTGRGIATTAAATREWYKVNASDKVRLWSARGPHPLYCRFHVTMPQRTIHSKTYALYFYTQVTISESENNKRIHILSVCHISAWGKKQPMHSKENFMLRNGYFKIVKILQMIWKIIIIGLINYV